MNGADMLEGMFKKKKKVYNNAFSNPELSHATDLSNLAKVPNSILFLDDYDPQWLHEGKKVPLNLPSPSFLSNDLPCLSDSIRLKVGKILEGRFQVSQKFVPILQVLKDPESSMADITEAIGKDAKLSARILMIINSEALGLTQEVQAVGRAIAMLGLDLVRAIVVISAVEERLSSYEKPRMNALWRHAALVSLCARAMVEKNPHLHEDADQVAMSGLLIHMGTMLFKPEEVQALSSSTGLPTRVIAALGASCFAERWGLSPKVAQILEKSGMAFDFPFAQVSSDIRLLAMTLAFAHFVVDWYGFGPQKIDVLPSIDFLQALRWVPGKNLHWITGEVALEMEKARLSLEQFLE